MDGEENNQEVEQSSTDTQPSGEVVMVNQGPTEEQIKKKEESKSAEKAGALAGRAAADYFTGGKYESVRNVPVAGAVAKGAEKVVGKAIATGDKLTGRRLGKQAKKLDDAGALDAADQALGVLGGGQGGAPGGAPKGGAPGGAPKGGAPGGAPKAGTPGGAPKAGTPGGAPKTGTSGGAQKTTNAQAPSGATAKPGGETAPSAGNQFAARRKGTTNQQSQTQSANRQPNRRNVPSSSMQTGAAAGASVGDSSSSSQVNSVDQKTGDSQSTSTRKVKSKGDDELDKDNKTPFDRSFDQASAASDDDKKKKKGLIGTLLTMLFSPIIICAGIALLLILSLVVVVIIIIASIGGFDLKDPVTTTDSGSSNVGSNCNYNVKTSTGTSFDISGIKVELINCDGKKSNYRVLETIDFEKYVLGVALAEAGEDSPDEAIKAQIIAARNFALTRSGGSKTGMCPGNYNSCFYGYNSTSKVIRMRACEADQVYWDYTKTIYRQDRGSISIYSPEINSGTVWKQALSSSRQSQVEALADSVKGITLVDSAGNLVETDYVASVTDRFISNAKSGMKYNEILEAQYGSGKTNSAECTNGSGSSANIDYGNYKISTDGVGFLHEPLSSFLTSKGSSLQEYNQTISNNVNKNGYGTRAGVVAAAVTLIGELSNKYGLKFPYFWGGGHEGMSTLANGNWGSNSCYTYANNQSYNYCGLDCSGFVSWALYNGGFKVSPRLAGSFAQLNGAQRVSLSDSAVLEAGDILDHEGHVILVVGVTKDGYRCAEAAGNQVGVIFSTRPFNLSGYWGVKMDGFYSNSANVRR